MIIAFTVISILVSLPCTFIVVMKVLETRGLEDYVKEYVSKLSIGAVFKAKI
jgi:hypothetical protein